MNVRKGSVHSRLTLPGTTYVELVDRRPYALVQDWYQYSTWYLIADSEPSISKGQGVYVSKGSFQGVYSLM